MLVYRVVSVYPRYIFSTRSMEELRFGSDLDLDLDLELEQSEPLSSHMVSHRTIDSSRTKT